jgi:hypothetical protein
VAPKPLEIKEGEWRIVIVKIERKGFKGPVKISVKNVPEGVHATSATIAEDRVRGEITITARYTSGARTATLTVVARAEELVAEAPLELTVSSRP